MYQHTALGQPAGSSPYKTFLPFSDGPRSCVGQVGPELVNVLLVAEQQMLPSISSIQRFHYIISRKHMAAWLIRSLRAGDGTDGIENGNCGALLPIHVQAVT